VRTPCTVAGMTLTCPSCNHPLQLIPADEHHPSGMLPNISTMLVSYLETVEVTDCVRATSHVFETETPSRALVERIRRRLERMTDQGILERFAGSRGGVSGGRTTLYRLTRDT
jgi:hypothetical protein